MAVNLNSEVFGSGNLSTINLTLRACTLCLVPISISNVLAVFSFSLLALHSIQVFLQWMVYIHNRWRTTLNGSVISKHVNLTVLNAGREIIDMETKSSTNDKLRILVKAQPGTRSIWPRSPTKLGIQPWDLGLPNEYSLSQCGHKFASKSRYYSLLMAIWHYSTSTLLAKLFFL